ncbi:hypothetical protein [Chryseobacterium sp. SIMBA_029]|uniref:hypothetical protein n=1 Tax=Chryseobacterium sp. SIMBA_029 TaxID=3085772 RepID=UPI00397A5DDC
MTPKGRIVVIRSTDTNGEALYGSVSDQFSSEISGLLSEQKNDRIEIMTTVRNLRHRCSDSYFKLLKEGHYNNIGCIVIGEKQDLNKYFLRISEAGVVVFVGNTSQICNALRGSAILELLNKKYQYEDNFTLVGINTAAMCISGLIVDETGVTNEGLGFINNCIIDTKFMHGERCKNLVKAVISHNQYVGLGLKSGMAVLIEKGYKASCIGSGSVMVVNAKNVENRFLKKDTSVYAKNLKGHILTPGSVFNLFSGNLIKNDVFEYSLNFINRNTIQ